MKLKPHELVLVGVLALLGWFLFASQPSESLADAPSQHAPAPPAS